MKTEVWPVCPELHKMANEYGIKLISIAQLIAYRLKQESLVEMGVEVDMPTEYGHFRLIPFRQKSNGLEHIAIIKGEVKGTDPVLVRVHSSCATGDIFGSMRCDCGEQLHKALQMIEKEGKGAVVYLNQEGRGIGLMDKMKAYNYKKGEWIQSMPIFVWVTKLTSAITALELRFCITWG